MDEIALLYFQQLDKKLRSKCRLIAGSVELTETMKREGKLITVTAQSSGVRKRDDCGRFG